MIWLLPFKQPGHTYFFTATILFTLHCLSSLSCISETVMDIYTKKKEEIRFMVTLIHKRRIQSVLMKCYHSILCIPCHQRGSPQYNQPKHRATQSLLSAVRRCKLRWYGHVTRSTCLVLRGTRERTAQTTSKNRQKLTSMRRK